MKGSVRKRKTRSVIARCWIFSFALVAGMQVGLHLQATADWKESKKTVGLPIDFVRDLRRRTIKFDASTSLGWAIFYNVFIPTDRGQEGFDNVKRIVQEQIHQIGASHAASIEGLPVSLFYNTIGEPDIVTPGFMHRLCSVEHNLNCTRMQHYSAGFEELTLQNALDFCMDNPMERVVYMHNKGSFNNPRNSNENWRFPLTEAALHKDCLDPPNGTCNLCGLQFFPIWATMVAGNFWTASCSYLKLLLPPAKYRDRMTAFAEERSRLLADGTLRDKLYLGRDEDRHCRGRYAAACWVGSHPSVRPCDLSEPASLMHWTQHYHSNATDYFDFDMAPRREVVDRWHAVDERVRERIMGEDTKRLREFHFLAGNILKWQWLYDQVPDDSSWVWSWFPDGSFWRDQVRAYGTNAVSVATGRFRSPPS